MNINKDILLVSEDGSFKDELQEKLSIGTLVRTTADIQSISSYRDICCILCDTTVEWRDFLDNIRDRSSFLPFILFLDKQQKQNIDIDRLSSIGLTDYYYKDGCYGLLENRVIETINFYLDGDEDRAGGLIEDILHGLKDIVYMFDSNGDFLFWNETAKEVTGYTDSEVSNLSPTDFFRGEDKEKIIKSITRILKNGGSERIEAELVTKNGETIPYEFRSRTLKNQDGELIGICGVGRDISERKHRVNQLSALNKTTRNFIDSENMKEIAEKAVDIAPDVLDLPIVCIYTIDKNHGRLDPITYTQKTEEVLGNPPSFSGGEETTWKTYIDGNTRIYDKADIQEKQGFFLNSEKNLESTIYIPIGDHGVFVGSSTSPIEYDTVDIEFIETYVSTIDSAFNSAKRRQKLRKREQQLQKRTERLENLDRLNQVLRTIAQAVIQTSTQKEIEKTVCNHIVDIEPYSFAWVGRYNTLKNTVEPKVTAGKHQNYLDNINISLQQNHDKKTLSIDLEKVETKQNILKNRSSGSWQEQALKRGYRSQITIPIKHKESIHGILQIYSNKINEFNQEKIKVLSQLGELIGHKINSIKRKEALLSGKKEKINIKTQDIDDFFSKILQKETEIQILSMIPSQKNSYVLFSNIQNINKTKIKDIAKNSKEIHKINFIDNKNNGHIVELEISENTSPAVLADDGSIPQKYTKKQNGVLIHIEIPHTTNTRKLIEKIQDKYPNTEIISKNIETKDENPAKTEQKIGETLTDRQWEIIQAAYFGGIYETPRQTTGKKLAKKLDITPPTLHQHLKEAQRKILKTILE